MVSDRLLEKVRSRGFDCLEDFVRANLHYLPDEKQKLFYSVCEAKQENDKYSGDYCAQS